MSDLTTQDVQRAWTNSVLFAILAVAFGLAVHEHAFYAASAITAAVAWKVIRI